jgi:hypothetical protein
VDTFLRRRSVIGAMKALRDRDPGLRFPDAQDMAEMRLNELHAAGLVEPAPQTTVDSLLAKARAIEHPIVVVEAYWDGDSHGWYARLVAVVERPDSSGGRYDEVYLGSLDDADTEDLAKGHAVAEALGVPFHFTQPERADLDLPRWWDGQ